MLVSRFAKLAIAVATLFGQVVIANNHCDKPSVRHEWRSLTRKQRIGWIDAVKCLNSLPHNSSLVPTFNTTYAAIPPINESSSYFDDFVYLHMDLNYAVHWTGYFLPWHRAYVKEFEIALQQKCNYTGTQPYWDWRIDAPNFENSMWWDPDPVSGLGGWGDPNDDHQITTGAFASGFPVSYPVPHRIRRQYTPIVPNVPEPLADLFTFETQKALVNGHVGDFIGFQAGYESRSHAAVHQIVGGDLLGNCPSNAVDCVVGAKWPPNDPLFFLHHAMIDKLWHDWQNTNPANFWSYGGGAVSKTPLFTPDPTYPTGAPPYMNFSTPMPTDDILNDYTVYELMDTKNERLCYTYSR